MNLSARPVDFAPALPRPIDDGAETSLPAEDREFMRWLLERAGVSVSHYRPESLARRLPACLRTLRANSTAHARAIIEREFRLAASAIGAVLIGVTSFFRDPTVFDDLDRLVLSEFINRASTRIWSVGCSDGMELYSVALQLAERRVLHRCHLLGSDCRVDATRTAAAGVFARQALRELPARLRETYFNAANASLCAVNPFVRAQLQWRTADVMSTPEPGPWDLILCRNMAMYMRGDTVAKLWDLLQNALRPGGYLVLGKAERPSGAGKLSMVAPCIFRRDKG
ncbi:protein-glutamate O-methyltransferase CheR [soil metagenome]